MVSMRNHNGLHTLIFPPQPSQTYRSTLLTCSCVRTTGVIQGPTINITCKSQRQFYLLLSLRLQVLILFHKHSTRIPSKCVVRSGKKLLDTRNRIFSCYCTGNTDAGRTTESNQLLVHQRLLQLVVNANHGPFLMQESDSFSTIRTPHLLHAKQNKEKYRKLHYKVF